MIKPTIPKGTRDFSPLVVKKRQFILSAIQTVFELHGFEPLETPAMENIDTLTGKYGEEGDKLMFRVLDNGDIFERARQAATTKELIQKVSEKALRYDLTIPFARYVVMHHQELPMPFKRYQMQPVWRADRPQKGRYREFYQCDADMVGSQSLNCELDLVSIYHEVFERLGLGAYSLQINNRKILAALADTTGNPELLVDMTIAIDKLDKIGLEGVVDELEQRGFATEQVQKIQSFLSIQGDNDHKLHRLELFFQHSPSGLKGVEELRYLLQSSDEVVQKHLQLDLNLARGLNYYTGMILEAKAPSSIKMGSIGGGGRYDDLTGLFGLKGVSGVGISFGVDRIYDVLEELQLFPELLQVSCKMLILHPAVPYLQAALRLMRDLRSHGISVELYPEEAKFDKQFKYAQKKGIPFIGILGEEELSKGAIGIKNLSTGEQTSIPIQELVQFPFDASAKLSPH